MAEQEIIEFSGLRVVRPKFLKCRQSEVRASFEATENGAPCIAYMLKTKNSTLFTADSTIKELEDECKYLGKLRHPNILQHLGVHCDKGGHVIITEQLYMSLDVYLAQGGDGFPTAVNFSVLRDVARGLQYLRSQSPIIVHRELFAENVHLGFDMRAKISVVGVSIPIDTEQVKSTDVAIYLPPEASEICSNPFHIDTKWDIYSFGILSIYTAMHKLPSKGGSVIEWMNGMGMKHPLYNLVSKCVQHHPPARLSIGKICHDLDSLCENYPFKITDIVELLQCINGTEPKCNHVEPKDRQKTCQSQPSSTTSSWYGTLAGIGTSVAGIGSKMVHNVTAVMMDTKKYDSPVDKDICMSQISCQPTIADGNEWVEVSKTKNPEDIKGDDDIAAKLHQIQIYKEDFENERKDRVSACVKLHECKVQLQKKDQELADIKVQLQSVKDKLGALEEIKISEKKKLTADLEAAKEEIAVKVAQVKQYQKQVEAYKHQSTNQLSHPEGIKRGKSFNNSEPHRHQPDVENEQAKRDRRDSILKPCAGANANVEEDGSPVHQNGATSQSSCEQMDTAAPLDPNLTCPICRLTFKKGEIQLYRQHAQHCNGLSS